MNQAVRVGVGREPLAIVQRGADPVRPERRIRIEQLVAQEAERDLRCGTPERGAERTAILLVHVHGPGRDSRRIDDVAAIDPRVPEVAPAGGATAVHNGPGPGFRDPFRPVHLYRCPVTGRISWDMTHPDMRWWCGVRAAGGSF